VGALDLVAALLAWRAGGTAAGLRRQSIGNDQKSIAIATPIPVHVSHFTADPDGEGGVRYPPDVYHSNNGAKASGDDKRCTR
jgi:murein L,D-transpeptidase YcbB/YkuD